MSEQNAHIFQAKNAGTLDNRIRRWFQNPQKILSPYVKAGMTVLDIGCGPGFFTLEMARLVGPTGHVIAADLQAEMLEIVRNKIQGTELAARITLHQCAENSIGVIENVDFILAFYIVHEVPNQAGFLSELKSILKPDGSILIIEPKFRVKYAHSEGVDGNKAKLTAKEAFAKTVQLAQDAGLVIVDQPKVFFSRSVLLSIALHKYGPIM